MVFVDANIVLEILLSRENKTRAARLLAGSDTCCLSVLSCHLVWYFGRKDGVADCIIQETIENFELLDSSAADYEWALRHEEGKDFEDALQVAAALRGGCDTFLTFDRRLAKRYKNLPLNFKHA